MAELCFSGIKILTIGLRARSESGGGEGHAGRMS